MSKQNSVYSNCNPLLMKLFKEAGDPSRLLCVALDFAKGEHTALICNGRGDMIKAAFTVTNDRAGTEKLLAEVEQAARKQRVRLDHVFIGGEDYPSFAENFLRRLRARKFLVVRVNAWEARHQRDNFQASTDRLDLLGIARCCLNRRAETVRDRGAAYANLRAATRQRERLVRDRTAASNRIYTYVDRVFPAFLDGSKSGLAPFCQASLELMAEGLCPARISRRRLAALAGWLQRRGVEDAPEKARQLKELARECLPPDPQEAAILQTIVRRLANLYRGLDESISALDREVAYWLAANARGAADVNWRNGGDARVGLGGRTGRAGGLAGGAADLFVRRSGLEGEADRRAEPRGGDRTRAASLQ
jgi:hypothetical protein